jgi:acetyl esterase/lipase
MLVILRDRGLPLPAGAILISPWVDLTHSFPSVAAGSRFDYIPEHGFMHRPSGAWPPPNADDLMAIRKAAETKRPGKEFGNGGTNGNRNRPTQTAIQGFAVRDATEPDGTEKAEHTYPGLQDDLQPVKKSQILANEADNLAVAMLDGTVVEIKDQIQMYAPNQLLSHPLVSPVLQPSLGGLPPLLILTGGGELLRDEQIYLAHKAADPTAYLPNDAYLDEHDPDRSQVNRFDPTYVQLQVWDDLCHVAPTLSWTRPAKFMFRSIAQFGAWALARAQQEDIDLPEEDASSTSSTASSITDSGRHGKHAFAPSPVGKAGDPLAQFHKHMIRQRVDRYGMAYPLDPPASIPALKQPRSKVGAINPIIVKKWLGAKKSWDERFAKQKLRVQRRRLKDFQHGYFAFDDETPPACAMASRRLEKDIAPPIKVRKSYAMMLWSMLASKQDKEAVEHEEKAGAMPQTNDAVVDRQHEDSDVAQGKTVKSRDGFVSRPKSAQRGLSGKSDQERSKSRSRVVSDAGQANDSEQSQSFRPDLVAGGNFTNGPWGETEVTRPSLGSRLASTNSGTATPTILIDGVDTGVDPHPLSRLDNASTIAVIDADGVIKARKDGTSLRPDHHSQSSAENVPNQPTMVSSDQRTLSLTDSESRTPTLTTVDADSRSGSNVSTKTLRRAPGVLKPDEHEKRSSTIDETSAERHASETMAAQAAQATESVEFHKSSEGGRPGMPDRDEFVTAEKVP